MAGCHLTETGRCTNPKHNKCGDCPVGRSSAESAAITQFGYPIIWDNNSILARSTLNTASATVLKNDRLIEVAVVSNGRLVLK
jgi:hypothetical protein